MIIQKFIEFLPQGSTEPFLALTDKEEKVVVKASLKPTSGKLLFNEFITGSLANKIRLPWPETYLATIDKQVVKLLSDQEKEIYSENCVATKFIDNLTPIPFPNLDLDDENINSDANIVIENMKATNKLKEINPSHLMRYFNQPETQPAFYGRALFEVWLFLEDSKYDTLFSLPDKTPFFLDGGWAFGFLDPDWDLNKLDYERISFPMSSYLEGILINYEYFENWFTQIKNIQDDYIHSLFDAIPSSWQIQKHQSDFFLDLLTNKRSIFIEICRNKLNELKERSL